MSISEDAVKLCKQNRVSFNEQIRTCMCDILHWEDDILQTECKRIRSKFPSIVKLLKSITIANIRILSTFEYYDVELNDMYVSRKTPNFKEFIHKVYIDAAKEFFHYPELLSPDAYKHRNRQFDIVVSVIRKVLNDYIPIDDMLSKLQTNDDDDDDVRPPTPMSIDDEDIKKEEIPVPMSVDENKEEESDDTLSISSSSLSSSMLSDLNIEEDNIRSKNDKSFF